MVRVLVYVDELTSTSIPVEMAAKAHTKDNVEVVLVSHFDKKNDNIGPNVEEMDIPRIRLGASSRIDFGAIKRLRQICTNRDIDILHTHPIAVGAVAHVLLSDVVGNIVTTEHSDYRSRGFARRFSKSITYPLVDVIVSNSQATKDSMSALEQIPSTNSKQTIIYNGANIGSIHSAIEGDTYIRDVDEPVIITVGRSIEEKNQETLIRAFNLVQNHNTESTLIIVGDGPLLTSHKKLVSKLGIESSVKFTGLLRRKDVYSVLKQSTLAVFPSWYEGFCVAAVEAMASGLPVVASDIDVFHEVIDDGGLYAPPDDPHAFSERILTLLNSPQMRSQIGDAAAERAKQKFPLERTGQEYARLYKEIADEEY